MKGYLVFLIVIFGAVSISAEIEYNSTENKENLYGTFTKENLDQAIQYCESLGVRFTALAEENNQLDDAAYVFIDPKNSSINTMKYVVYTDLEMSWHRANHYCISHNMHLVSITSQSEQDEIVRLIRLSGFGTKYHHFWTSGSRIDNGKEFYWMGHGKPFTFTAWNQNEPNGLDGSDKCIEMWDYGTGMLWNDAPCEQLNFFVCEHWEKEI